MFGNYFKYRNDLIHKSTQAHALYVQASKTKEPKDWKKLDQHMRQLEINYQELYYGTR